MCVWLCVCSWFPFEWKPMGSLSDGTISNPKHAKLHCQIEIVTDSTDNISRSFLLVSKLTIYWFVCFYIKRKERKFVLFTYLILVWGYFVGCRWSTSPTTCGTFDFFGYSKFLYFSILFDIDRFSYVKISEREKMAGLYWLVFLFRTVISFNSDLVK